MMKKIICFILCMMMIVGILPTKISNVSAIEGSDKVYELYDAYGNLIYTGDSLKEVESYMNNSNNRGADAAYKKICKFGGKFISGVSNVFTVIAVVYATADYLKGESDMISAIESIVQISVLERLAREKIFGYLYANPSVFNPYPPHSYEGVLWIRNHTYYVLEG